MQRSKAVARGADVIMMVVSAFDGWTNEDDDIFGSLWDRAESEGMTSSPEVGSNAMVSDHDCLCGQNCLPLSRDRTGRS